jgi:hypothetical protein
MYYDELYHHGVKGMKWGVRRYQNADGSLTPAGKKRLSTYKDKEINRAERKWDKAIKRTSKKASKAVYRYTTNETDRKYNKAVQKATEMETAKRLKKTELRNIKKMSYDDMTADKINTGKTIVNSMLETAVVNGGLALAGVPVRYISIPNIGVSKTVHRVSDKETIDILNKAKIAGEKYVRSKCDVSIKVNKLDDQKIQAMYHKFYADDIEGVIKNMSEKQYADVRKHVGKQMDHGDWPEVEDYVFRKYGK